MQRCAGRALLSSTRDAAPDVLHTLLTMRSRFGWRANTHAEASVQMMRLNQACVM